MSSPPALRRSGGLASPLLRDPAGQSTALALFLILVFVLLALPFVSFALAENWVVATQRAADAAALAGAQRATLLKQMDARGYVYCETVLVDAAPAVRVAQRYWTVDTEGIPLRSQSLAAAAHGAALTVSAQVAAPPLAFRLFGQMALRWVVSARATAVLPPGAPPACG